MNARQEYKPNVVLITLDSLRWDSYSAAVMPFLNSLCPARRAYSQATFTYAAHLAMLQGILPSTRERLPFYNRYAKQLIRIANRPSGPESLICFPMDTEDIAVGFMLAGYRTICIGAMEWFRHPHLGRNFDFFMHTGIDAARQVDVFGNTLRSDAPTFALINFGETHDPYQVGQGMKVPAMEESRARRVASVASGEIDHAGLQRQKACCEYLDDSIQRVFSSVADQSRNTIFIVCGDHGECFGEDGYFGHGFYHPKVMEVPLAIFDRHGELLVDSPSALPASMQAR